jgi:cobalamin biosynthesis protein CobD/CbiB
MQLNELQLNDIVQWIAVAIILIVVVLTIVRKTLRFQRQLKKHNSPSCNCGCSSCHVSSNCAVTPKHKQPK